MSLLVATLASMSLMQMTHPNRIQFVSALLVLHEASRPLQVSFSHLRFCFSVFRLAGVGGKAQLRTCNALVVFFRLCWQVPA